MPRPYYAPTYQFRAGVQSAYDAGLSYFPDYALAPSPLGFDLSTIASDVGGAIGFATGGPAGAVAGSTGASAIFGQITGGTAVDQARQARVNYFANLASQGNVAAMQLILGAPPNVSGNEQQMWVNAANALRTAAPDVYSAALQAGPAWLTNSGDTATNYPAMRQFVQTWAAQHPFTAAGGAISGAIGSIFTPQPPTSGVPSSVPYYPTAPGSGPVLTPPTAARASSSPLVLYAALGLGAYFLMGRRRRS
jgi:hypothetical protein